MAAAALVLGLVACSSSSKPNPPFFTGQVFGANGWFLSVPDKPVPLEEPVSVWILAHEATTLTLEVRSNDSLVVQEIVPVPEAGVDKWFVVGIPRTNLQARRYNLRLLDQVGKLLVEAPIEVTP